MATRCWACTDGYNEEGRCDFCEPGGWVPDLPDLDEMRADLVDAGQSGDGPEASIVALWCDLFEIPEDHPEYRALA